MPIKGCKTCYLDLTKVTEFTILMTRNYFILRVSCNVLFFKFCNEISRCSVVPYTRIKTNLI